MKKLLLLSILTTIATGCLKSDMFSDIHIEPNTTIPLGRAVITDSSLFTMANIYDQLKVNDQDVIYFAVNGNTSIVQSGNLDEILSVPTQSFDFQFNIPPSQPGIIDLPNNLEQLFYMNLHPDEKIDKLVLNSGQIVFTLESTGKDMSDVRCTIPQITKNGQPVTLTPGEHLQLNPSYVIEPTHTPIHNNGILVKLSGKSEYVPQIKGKVEIISSDLNQAVGFFGNKTLTEKTTTLTPGTSDFNDFTNQAKYVYFRDPSIELEVGNQLDIPVMVTINKFQVDGVDVKLKPTYGNQRYLIAGQTIAKIRIDNSKTVSGNDFSNAITKSFKSITLGIASTLNPTVQELGSPIYVPEQNNSINGTDTLGLVYDVRLPFDCVLEDVKFIQTIDMNLSDMADNKDQNYEQLAMRISGYNQMPLNVALNPYITDDNDPNSTPTYLFSQPVNINATDSKLKPSNPNFLPYVMDVHKATIQVIDKQVIDKLLKAKKLFLNLTTSTRNADNTVTREAVKFYSPSELGLDIMIGAQADINITPQNK